MLEEQPTTRRITAMKKRMTLEAVEGKGIVFLRGEKVDVSFDVHKKDYSATMWSERRQEVLSKWVQPADPEGAARALKPFKRRIKRVVYEAGPTGYSLARVLRKEGFKVDVIAPSRTPKSTGQQAKSDRLDSRRLAMWSAKGLLQAVHIPTEEEEGDRQVFRMRDQVVAKRRRIKQQIKSFLLQHGIAQPQGLKTWSRRGVQALHELKLSEQLRFSLDILLEDLAHYEAQYKKVNKALRELGKTARHKESVEALQTVHGVGPITAMAMRTELIAPHRFHHGREVSAMAGLAPLVTRTGSTVHEGRLMKCGNPRLRKVLIEAAWRWVAKDPWAGQRYAELIRNTGERKKAIAAMARRLVIILWRMSLTKEAYRPRALHKEKTPTQETINKKGRQLGLTGKGKADKARREKSRALAADPQRPFARVAAGVVGRLPGRTKGSNNGT
jgi:transposase